MVKTYIIFFLLLINGGNISAQPNDFTDDLELKIKTKGRLVKANKLVLIIEIEVPDGWKLKVEDGYESMLDNDIDTVDMALKFKRQTSFLLQQRLKADRKPSTKGYFYKNITFAQTITIDTSKLPINIDAQLKWFAYKLNEKNYARGLTCCLLQVCKKRKNVETVRVGWNCDRRNKIYLEDVTIK